jgi:hypothetical protein
VWIADEQLRASTGPGPAVGETSESLLLLHWPGGGEGKAKRGELLLGLFLAGRGRGKEGGGA